MNSPPSPLPLTPSSPPSGGSSPCSPDGTNVTAPFGVTHSLSSTDTKTSKSKGTAGPTSDLGHSLSSTKTKETSKSSGPTSDLGRSLSSTDPSSKSKSKSKSKHPLESVSTLAEALPCVTHVTESASTRRTSAEFPRESPFPYAGASGIDHPEVAPAACVGVSAGSASGRLVALPALPSVRPRGSLPAVPRGIATVSGSAAVERRASQPPPVPARVVATITEESSRKSKRRVRRPSPPQRR